ncbi:MAG: DNA polymerase I [Planctomycetes bacterium]|nr:DNA polymerase I [Planctomycetota bacterium]
MPASNRQQSFDLFASETAPEAAEIKQTELRPADLRGKTVYAIDTLSLIFQLYHALPEMASPRGEPVSAVFGFVRDMLHLLEKKKPHFLLCALDMPGKTFRDDLYDRYKADRTAMPDDLVPQIDSIMRLLEGMEIPAVGVSGFEADDVLATIARMCDEAGANCFLVTGDKDCRQLISDHVKIYNVRKDQVYDAAALLADWGIRPDQVVDYQALVGDAVDNIPGVPMVGPKAANELLAQFGTLDNVLANVDQVKGAKRQQNLREYADQARLSRTLARLDTNVSFPLDWNAARAHLPQPERMVPLMRDWGFRTLLEKFGGAAAVRADEEWEADYQCISTPESLTALVEKLNLAPRLSVDLETRITQSSEAGVWPRWAEIVGYALCAEPGVSYYVPVHVPPGEPHVEPQVALDLLKPLLENPAVQKIGQNLKYELIVLRSAGVRLAGVTFDTMLASYLLEAGERNHGLDELSLRYLKHTTVKIEELIGSGKNQKRMDEVPVPQITHYAAEDADVPMRLLPMLQERLDALSLNSLFIDLEMPLVEILADMEFQGIRVDVDRLKTLSDEFGRRMALLETEIHALAGRSLNINSPKQLAVVLFDELKLPVLKKTKTGPSTDADVLEELARQHPLPAKIIEYRQYAKLKGTYVDALPSMIHPETGRVHASFHQTVAATGRLSSSDPNLQNIPIRTDVGREIRSAFLPGFDGWKIVAADYSQIELRVLAHFSGDETLCAAFARDEDIHALVASQVYNVPLAEVTSEQRRAAKAVNFGIIYGQSPFGLAKALDIEPEEAAAFIDAYFARYPQVNAFMLSVLADCHRNSFVSTIAGRRRNIEGVRSESPGYQRNLAERTAINTVIQGSAADLIKQAMIDVHRRLKRENLKSKMLLQIHDELLFEVPPEELDTMVALVKEEMSGAAKLKVPLKVDAKIGNNWADVEAL